MLASFSRFIIVIVCIHICVFSGRGGDNKCAAGIKIFISLIFLLRTDLIGGADKTTKAGNFPAFVVLLFVYKIFDFFNEQILVRHNFAVAKTFERVNINIRESSFKMFFMMYLFYR